MTNRSRIKHDHAAHRLAGLHRGKTLVDLGQFQLRRNPVLQVQLAAHVQLDKARHVDAEMIRTHGDPRSLRSRRKSKGCGRIFWANGIIPTMVAVPPGASIAKPCSAVSLRPSTSNEWCTPPLVRSRTCLTTSPLAGSMMSVAP